MRGTIIRRSKTSWAIVIDHGRDPITKKRKQRWIKFPLDPSKNTRENMALANAKLAELLHQLDKGTYVDASKVTLIEYMRDWHTKKVAHTLRPETSRIYSTMINVHIAKSNFAAVPLQKIRASDLESLYATVKLAPSSITVLHAVISRALKTAVRDRIIPTNPAADVENRPKANKDPGEGARQHCWTAEEARKVLAAAKADGPQVSAFFAVMLDTGCRKSEALGLTWANVDLSVGTITIDHQLKPRSGEKAAFAPTKTGKARTVTLGAETISRLKLHRKQQAELRLRNAPSYTNSNLIFAKEPIDVQNPTSALGQPCMALVGRHFHRVVKAAAVRSIKVHGLRHSTATLLLSAGVPVQVVAQRLGHADVTQTLSTYAHVTPNLQADAAARLDALLGS